MNWLAQCSKRISISILSSMQASCYNSELSVYSRPTSIVYIPSIIALLMVVGVRFAQRESCTIVVCWRAVTDRSFQKTSKNYNFFDWELMIIFCWPLSLSAYTGVGKWEPINEPIVAPLGFLVALC